MTTEISTMRLNMWGIQEAWKSHDPWMKDVPNTLQQHLTEDIIILKKETNTKLLTKVGNVVGKEANDNLDAYIKTVRDMVSSLRLDFDARRRKVDGILATIKHDITAGETNLAESKAKITSDLNGPIDFTNKDFAARLERLLRQAAQNLVRNMADTEAWLKNNIQQKQQAAFEKNCAVPRLPADLAPLDLRMSGVQGGLGEHKRDILKCGFADQGRGQVCPSGGCLP
jgi:hypothetical protein